MMQRLLPFLIALAFVGSADAARKRPAPPDVRAKASPAKAGKAKAKKPPPGPSVEAAPLDLPDVGPASPAPSPASSDLDLPDLDAPAPVPAPVSSAAPAPPPPLAAEPPPAVEQAPPRNEGEVSLPAPAAAPPAPNEEEMPADASKKNVPLTISLPLVAPPEDTPIVVRFHPREDTPAPKALSLLAGLSCGATGRDVRTAHNLYVGDDSSALLGVSLRARVGDWSGELRWEHVLEDRWLASNVRADSADLFGLRVSRTLWQPTEEIRVGVGFGAHRMAHAGARWWTSGGVTPVEYGLELAPSFEWRAAPHLVFAYSVPFGYGFGSVDARKERDFAGAFLLFENAILALFEL